MEAKLLTYRDQVIQEFKNAQLIPTDYFPEFIRMSGANKVWGETQGQGTVIAVLDTGVDHNHKDLKDNIIGGRNFTTDYNGDPTNYMDNHHHGTHVAGIIAADGNQTGIIGVAPKAKIFACKVLTSDGRGNADWVAQAVRYCINWRGPNGEKINIINMSLGIPSYHAGLHLAIKDAVASGISVIVAAGNEGDGSEYTNELSYPALFPEVIAVGAIDVNENVATFSNSNQEVDVSGLGVDVISCYPQNRYAVLNGTSMACPHVTGMAALIRERFHLRLGRYPSEKELYHLIKYSTVDVHSVGIDASTGAGLVSFLPEKV